MEGIARIINERLRQIKKERFDAEHDTQHVNGELAAAAGCYAQFAAELLAMSETDKKLLFMKTPEGGRGQPRYCAAEIIPADFPHEWAGEWWKPSRDPIRNLEKAGALIAAQIDTSLNQLS